jgi:glycosyltransferase involved in cell wall biosynthesis
MHILFVSEYFPPHVMGGGELSAFELVRALARRGHRVSVLTSRFAGDPDEETRDGVEILRRLDTGAESGTLRGNLERGRFTASVERELPALVRELSPDVVHAMNITSMPGVARAVKEAGPPTLAHVNSPLAVCPKGTKIRHGSECTINCQFARYFVPCFVTSQEMGRLTNARYLKYNPAVWFVLYRRWMRIRGSLGRFRRLTPISDFMRRWLERYGIDGTRTTVVPPAADPTAFAAPADPQNDVPRLLYLGGYVHIKGLQVVIDALEGIEHPYDLHCYGGGPDREALQEFARSKGVSAVFHGEFEESETTAILAGADVVLVPSLAMEAFGRVALEGMAAGRPVIASRSGGLPEVVDDGKTGLLAEPGEPEAWRSAIRALLADPELRLRMGHAAVERTRARFSEEGMVSRMIEAYEKAAA